MSELVKNVPVKGLDIFGDAAATIATKIKESQAEADRVAKGDAPMQYVKFLPAPAPHPWVYGKAKTRIPKDAVLVIDPSFYEHGWFGYPKGQGNKRLVGVPPVEAFSPWYDTWPQVPQIPNNQATRAYRMRMAVESCPSAPSLVGVVMEYTESRLMADGFGELETALRDRHSAFMAATGPEREEIKANFFPRVRLDFNLDVTVKSGGTVNQGVLVFDSWGPAFVRAPGEEFEAAPEDDNATAADLLAEGNVVGAVKATRRQRPQ